MLRKATTRIDQFLIHSMGQVTPYNILELRLRLRTDDYVLYSQEFLVRRLPDALEVMLTYTRPQNRSAKRHIAHKAYLIDSTPDAYWKKEGMKKAEWSLRDWTSRLEHHLMDQHRKRGTDYFRDCKTPLYLPDGPWERLAGEGLLVRRVFEMPSRYHPPLVTLTNGLLDQEFAYLAGSRVTMLYESENPSPKRKR